MNKNQNYKKKSIAIFLWLLLFFPTAQEVFHLLEAHEHPSCSISEDHLHSANWECSCFYYAFTTAYTSPQPKALSYSLVSPIDKVFFDVAQQIKANDHFKIPKLRGPPLLI